MDKKGELTGDDIAYIYPDMRMAMKVRKVKIQYRYLCVTGHIWKRSVGARSDLRVDWVLRGATYIHLWSDLTWDSSKEHDIFIPVFSQPSGQTYEFEAPSIR